MASSTARLLAMSVAKTAGDVDEESGAHVVPVDVGELPLDCLEKIKAAANWHDNLQNRSLDAHWLSLYNELASVQELNTNLPAVKQLIASLEQREMRRQQFIISPFQQWLQTVPSLHLNDVGNISILLYSYVFSHHNAEDKVKYSAWAFAVVVLVHALRHSSVKVLAQQSPGMFLLLMCLDDYAVHMPPGFEKEILGSSRGTITPFAVDVGRSFPNNCTDIKTVGTHMAALCNEHLQHLVFRLLGFDSWLSSLLAWSWPHMKWKQCFQSLRWSSDDKNPVEFLATLNKLQVENSLIFQPTASDVVSICKGLFNNQPPDYDMLYMICKCISDSKEDEEISKLVAVSKVLERGKRYANQPSATLDVVINAIAAAALLYQSKDVAQLLRSHSVDKTFLSCAELAYGSKVLAEAKEAPSKAIGIIEDSFVLCCMLLEPAIHPLEKLVEGLADNTTPYQQWSCGVFTYAMLTGSDAIASAAHGLYEDRFEDLAQLVDSLAWCGNGKYKPSMVSNLAKILAVLHLLMASSVESTAQVISKSKFLKSVNTGPPFSQDQLFLQMEEESLHIPPVRHLEALLMVTQRMHRFITKELDDSSILSGSCSVVIFWSVFSKGVAAALKILLQRSINIADDMRRIEQVSSKFLVQSNILEAILYSEIIWAVGEESPERKQSLLWETPHLATMLSSCYQASRTWNSKPWLKSAMECYENTKVQLEMKLQHMKSGNYCLAECAYLDKNRENFEAYSTVLGIELVKDVPGTTPGVEETPWLKHRDDFTTLTKDLQPILEWLRQINPGLGDVNEDYNTFNSHLNGNSTLDSLCECMRQLQQKYIEPLSGRNISNDCCCSLKATILKLSQASATFSMRYVRYCARNRLSPLAHEELWDVHAQGILKATFNKTMSLLNGGMTFEEMGQLIEFVRSPDFAKEVTHLVKFFKPERDVEVLKIVLGLVCHFRHGHISNLLRVIEAFECVDKADVQLLQLKELDSVRNPLQNLAANSIYDNYAWLHELLEPLASQHFELLRSLQNGSLKELVKYFVDRGAEFPRVREILNMRFRGDEVMNQKLTGVILAREMMSAFLRPETATMKDCLQSFAKTHHVSVPIAESACKHLPCLLDHIDGNEQTQAEVLKFDTTQLTERGRVRIILCSLTDGVSTLECSYSDSDNKSGKVMNRKQVLDFRTGLMQLNPFQGGDSGELTRQAQELYSCLDQAEVLFQHWIDLETDGHLAAQACIHEFELNGNSMKRAIEDVENRISQWRSDLVRSREDCHVLKLFTDREIGMMMALLSEDKIRQEAIKQLCGGLDNEDDEQQWQHMALLECGDDLAVHGRAAKPAERQACTLLLSYFRSAIPMVTALSHMQERILIEVCKSSGDDVLLRLTSLCESSFAPVDPKPNGGTHEQVLCTVGPISSHLIAEEHAEHPFSSEFLLLLQAFMALSERLDPPSRSQLLLSSPSTSCNDLDLFFSRIRTFKERTFIVSGLERLSYNSRYHLVQLQKDLSTQQDGHARVIYTTLSSELFRVWPRNFLHRAVNLPMHPPLKYLKEVEAAFRSRKVQYFYGAPGTGKTFIAQKEASTSGHPVLSASVSKREDLRQVRRTLSALLDREATVVIHVTSSLDSDDDFLNYFFFELVVCGILTEQEVGAVTCFRHYVYSLYIDIDHEYKTSDRTSLQNQIMLQLPVLVATSKGTEVTPGNNPMQVHRSGIRAASQLYNAYKGGHLMYCVLVNSGEGCHTNGDQNHIRESNARRLNIPRLSENIYPLLTKEFLASVKLTTESRTTQMLFFAHLKLRLQAFLSTEFLENALSIPTLPELYFKQAVYESRYLCKCKATIDWKTCTHTFWMFDEQRGSARILCPPNCPKCPLALHYAGSMSTTAVMKQVYNLEKSSMEVIANTFGISEDQVRKLKEEKAIILSNDFVFKLLLINDRKRTKKPLVLEGDTGVGKTFLLTTLEQLWALQSQPDQIAVTCPWLIELVRHMWSTLAPRGRLLFAADASPDYPVSHRQEGDPETAPKTLRHRLQACSFDAVSLKNAWLELLTNHFSAVAQQSAINELRRQVSAWLNEYVMELPKALSDLVQKPELSLQESGELMDFWLATRTKSLFFKYVVHPSITKEDLKRYLEEPVKMADDCKSRTVVIFFDEVNASKKYTSVFKDLIMDRMLDGKPVCKHENIFFCAAINPHTLQGTRQASHTQQNRPIGSPRAFCQPYSVRDMPKALSYTTWIYGNMIRSDELRAYISAILNMQDTLLPLPCNVCNRPDLKFGDLMKNQLCKLIQLAHWYHMERVSERSVSQRDIQRVFDCTYFFWKQGYTCSKAVCEGSASPINTDFALMQCVKQAVAVVYYFRLPVKALRRASSENEAPAATSEECNDDRAKIENVCREDFLAYLSKNGAQQFEIAAYVEKCINIMVTKENFKFPTGVALTPALKENIYCILACIQARIPVPLCIIGHPGTSKTLSFQIVRDNLLGRYYSPKEFCKRFHAVDVHECQCTRETTARQLEDVMQRACDRQRQYGQDNGGDWSHSLCVVLLDEAGFLCDLPDEDGKHGQMVLKALHPFLDKREVAFVALSNDFFDPANINRMVNVYRDDVETGDLLTLAKGCIGVDDIEISDHVKTFLERVCRGYQALLQEPEWKKFFHHRDLIALFRYLRRKQVLNDGPSLAPLDCQEHTLLHALEETFGGQPDKKFNKIIEHFFPTTSTPTRRDILSILESSQSDTKYRNGDTLIPRYRIFICTGGDTYSIAEALKLLKLFNSPSREHVILLASQLPGDGDDLSCNQLLTEIRRCMRRPVTLVLLNSGKIRVGLYKLFNQFFEVFDHGERRVIYTNVAVAGATYPSEVDPNFSCVVLMSKEDASQAPSAFLSRFSKFLLPPLKTVLLSRCHMELATEWAIMIRTVQKSLSQFVKLMGEKQFMGFRRDTIEQLMLNEPAVQRQDGLGELSPCSEILWEKIRQSTTPLLSHTKRLVRLLACRLLQLVSPEHFVARLKYLNMEGRLKDTYFSLYFRYLCHSTLKSMIDMLLKDGSNQDGTVQKCLLYVVQAVPLFSLQNLIEKVGQENHCGSDISAELEIANGDAFQRQADADSFLSRFMESSKLCAVILVDASWMKSQESCVETLKYLIDQKVSEQLAKAERQRQTKTILLLVHCFPVLHSHSLPSASFMNGWNTHYCDLFTGKTSAILDIELLAQLCSKQCNEKDVETQLKRRVKSSLRILAQEYCDAITHLDTGDVSCAGLPEEYRNFFVSHMTGGEAVSIPTPPQRSESLIAILSEHEWIVDTIASCILKYFSQTRAIELLGKLSVDATTSKTGMPSWAFSDFLERHTHRRIFHIFQRVVTEVVSDFNLHNMLHMQADFPQLGEKLQVLLTRVIQERLTKDISANPRSYSIKIRCSTKKYRTPFLKHIKSRLKHICPEKKNALHAQVKNCIESDTTCLGPLFRNKNFAISYMSDCLLNLSFMQLPLLPFEVCEVICHYFQTPRLPPLVDCSNGYAPSIASLWILNRKELQEIGVVSKTFAHLHWLLHSFKMDVGNIWSGLQSEENEDNLVKKLARIFFESLLCALPLLSTPDANVLNWSEAAAAWHACFQFMDKFWPASTKVYGNEDMDLIDDYFLGVYQARRLDLVLMQLVDVLLETQSYEVCKTSLGRFLAESRQQSVQHQKIEWYCSCLSRNVQSPDRMTAALLTMRSMLIATSALWTLPEKSKNIQDLCESEEIAYVLKGVNASTAPCNYSERVFRVLVKTVGKITNAAKTERSNIESKLLSLVFDQHPDWINLQADVNYQKDTLAYQYMPPHFPCRVWQEEPSQDAAAIFKAPICHVYFQIELKRALQGEASAGQFPNLVSKASPDANVLQGPRPLSEVVCSTISQCVRTHLAFQRAAEIIRKLCVGGHELDGTELFQESLCTLLKHHLSYQSAKDQDSRPETAWFTFFVAQIVARVSPMVAASTVESLFCHHSDDDNIKSLISALRETGSSHFTPNILPCRDTHARELCEFCQGLDKQLTGAEVALDQINPWLGFNQPDLVREILSSNNQEDKGVQFAFLFQLLNRCKQPDWSLDRIIAIAVRMHCSTLLQQAVMCLHFAADTQRSVSVEDPIIGSCQKTVGNETDVFNDVLWHFLAVLLSGCQAFPHIDTAFRHPEKLLEQPIVFASFNIISDHAGESPLSPVGAYISRLFLYSALFWHLQLQCFAPKVADSVAPTRSLPDQWTRKWLYDKSRAAFAKLCIVAELPLNAVHFITLSATLNLVTSQCQHSSHFPEAIVWPGSWDKEQVCCATGFEQLQESLFQMTVVDSALKRREKAHEKYLSSLCHKERIAKCSGEVFASFVGNVQKGMTIVDLRAAVAFARSEVSQQHPFLWFLLSNLKRLQRVKSVQHVARAYFGLHDYLGNLVAKDEVISQTGGLTLEQVFEKVRSSSRARMLKAWWELGRKYYNGFYKSLGHNDCCKHSSRQQLCLLPPNPLLNNVICTSEFSPPSPLLQCVADMINVQDTMIRLCRHYSTHDCLAHFDWKAAHLNSGISLRQSIDHKGYGLIKINIDYIEMIAKEHYSDGKFSLEQIEKILLNHYMQDICLIPWRKERTIFTFKESEAGQESMHSLIGKIPPDFPCDRFNTALTVEAADQIEDGLKTQHFRGIWKLLGCLVSACNRILETCQGEDKCLPDITRYQNTYFHVFVEQNCLPEDVEYIKEMGVVSRFQLKNLVPVYNMCSQQLQSHQYLLCRMPLVFSEAMSSELREDVRNGLRRYRHEERCVAEEASDNALIVLQRSFQQICNAPEVPIKSMFPARQDGQNIFSYLPVDVKGCHLKDLMALLLEFGFEARPKVNISTEVWKEVPKVLIEGNPQSGGLVSGPAPTPVRHSTPIGVPTPKEPVVPFTPPPPLDEVQSQPNAAAEAGAVGSEIDEPPVLNSTVQHGDILTYIRLIASKQVQKCSASVHMDRVCTIAGGDGESSQLSCSGSMEKLRKSVRSGHADGVLATRFGYILQAGEDVQSDENGKCYYEVVQSSNTTHVTIFCLEPDSGKEVTLMFRKHPAVDLLRVAEMALWKLDVPGQVEVTFCRRDNVLPDRPSFDLSYRAPRLQIHVRNTEQPEISQSIALDACCSMADAVREAMHKLGMQDADHLSTLVSIDEKVVGYDDLEPADVYLQAGSVLTICQSEFPMA